MNIKRHASEKGQAVIFLVVGLVVFLGFIALAVDGGMAYSDRRHAQNSADSASLAGGAAASIYMEEHNVFYSSWQGGCQNNSSIYNARLEAVQAAIARAAANGFEIDTDPADGSCWLGGILVDQQHQRRGYGRQAINATLDLLAREQGFRAFALSYQPANLAARRLYASMGFVESGEWEDDGIVARLRRDAP